MILSAFAKNVFTLYITMGFGTGFGFGMIYLPAIVSVTMYFERLRSLATGIAVCGSGFGTVIFAPIIKYFIANYSWQGALMIVAGICFVCTIFGYMFKPLVFEDESEQGDLEEVAPMNNNNVVSVKGRSDHDLTNSTLLSPNGHQQIVRSHSIGNDLIKNGVSNGKAARDAEEKRSIALSLSQPLLNQQTCVQRPIKSSGSGTLNRPDAFYTGSTHNLAKHKSHTSIHTDTDRYGSLRRRSDNVELDEKTEICGCIPCSQEAHETINKMMSLSLLKDPIFILFTVSNFLTR